MAAGKENGGINVWNIGTGAIIRERKKSNEADAQCIVSIDWNPKENGELAYTDNSGQFGLIENITESDENFPDNEEAVAEDDDIDFGDSRCPFYPNLFILLFSFGSKQSIYFYLVDSCVCR